MPHYMNGRMIPVVGTDRENIEALKVKKKVIEVPVTLTEAPKAEILKPEKPPKKSTTKRRKRNA